MEQKKNYFAGNVQNLLLFQKFYEFDAYIEPIIERFPTFEKSAWCASLKSKIIEVMELIIKTNRSSRKCAGWYEIDTQIELLRIYFRRMREKKYLSIRSYENTEKRLDEIGRILGGLIKKDKEGY